MSHTISLFILLACISLMTGYQRVHAADSNTVAVIGSIAATDADLKIRKLGSSVWIHTSHHTFPDGTRYPANGLIVREDDGLLLIDPAWGAAVTAELLARIKNETGLPVRRAISTHFHGDRTDGVDVLTEAGVEVLAHPRTLKLSALDGGPVPKNALAGIDEPGDTVAVGTVEVLYPGAGHTPDNIMVWLPKQKVLYGGCAIREMDTDTLGNTRDADLVSWPDAIRLAQQRYRQVEIVVPGHGNPGGPELLSHMFQLFEQID